MDSSLSSDGNYWLSDLHLFANRSRADEHLEDILSAARQAELFVLGGDIFDFSWSTHENVERTVDDAINWLNQLVRHAPCCHFHFLLGNHDFHQSFIDRLAEFEESVSNFQWHAFVLRLEDTLFLHGDAADARMTGGRLARRRKRWLTAAPRRPIWHQLYDLAVAVRLHRLVSTVVYRDERVTRRLLSYLREMGHGPETGVQHVYFGHTHVPMSYYEADGVWFHNGGAPLKGLPFQILEPIIVAR